MSLISAEALLARLDNPNLRLADCRWYLGKPGQGRVAFDEGHIPGAIHVDLDTDLATPDGLGAPGRHPLPDPVAFATHLGSLGIGTDHEVVAYDDVGGWVAARLWWMLDTLGHWHVSVLDGGLAAWTAAAYPMSTRSVDLPPATLALADRWSGTIERDELRRRLGKVVLLDARGAPRYRGETEPVDPVAGHIPTARNAPTDGNLGPDGRFLTAIELGGRFTGLGADGSDGPVVTSCGSGTSACHHALAMRVAGLPDPILYVGSYSDWSRSGYPVAVGPEPGKPPD